MTLQLALVSSAVLATAFAWTTPAHADMTKYSCRGPTTGPVEAIVDDNACVGYRVKASDGTVTSTVAFPFKGSGELIASDDGRTVVMLQSYLPGGIDPQGNVVELVGASDRRDPIGIWIYRDGAVVASHHIDALLGTRKHLVTQSISHVHWVQTVPPAIGSQTFTITTSSFRSITFETKTGRIRAAADAPSWTRCDDIVAGNLDLDNGQMLTTRSLKTGQRSAAISFVAKPGVALTDKAFLTVCLERRDHQLVLTELL